MQLCSPEHTQDHVVGLGRLAATQSWAGQWPWTRCQVAERGGWEGGSTLAGAGGGAREALAERPGSLQRQAAPLAKAPNCLTQLRMSHLLKTRTFCSPPLPPLTRCYFLQVLRGKDGQAPGCVPLAPAPREAEERDPVSKKKKPGLQLIGRALA